MAAINRRLQKQTTRYPLHLRKNQSKPIAETIKKVGEQTPGEQTQGKPHPPVIIALLDSNGYLTLNLFT
jgi:hypothetical protein